ncbi:hypothetical protein [Dechloromonas denitrificans]|uniref:hypothetical protein n=1 Tax=Dechloromonas denitrificans TaxID=281362 RepID=UPI001CF90B82|nr:hypothetical protein [Dechloromonas denitrificans]UCV03338.1 hypothetical protein KI611_20105 [Dechloromonas denitrificans]
MLLGLILVLSGCAGQRAFTTAARAGDTVALPLGWAKSLARQNTTVVITGANSATFTYPPNDPNVRAVANLYPDPVSRLIVGTETNQSLGVNANLYGANIESVVTNYDKDLSQTILVLNLPATLVTGTASIVVKDQFNTSVTAVPMTIDIIPGVGGANPLQQNNSSTTLSTEMAANLERADIKTITFAGATIPYGIQIDLTRTPAVGKPWVVNPRGDVKSLSWWDDGSTIRVILTPANGVNLASMANFKFYVAGGVTGLAFGAVKAFDSNGNIVPGITPQIN